jgi:hypothetical protein
MSQESSGGEAPRIANTKQLLFAIVLGVVVVVLYNVQVNSIRNETKAEVPLTVYKYNKKAGEVLRGDDVETRMVPKAVKDGLPSVLAPEQIRGDEKLQRDVPAGQFVFHEDLYGGNQDRPSHSLSDDEREYALPVDPQNMGRVLRVGDKIDVLAMMPNGAGGYRATLVISGVTVRSIGGISAGTAQVSRQADTEGVSSYRTVGIQVRGDEVFKLLNLRTWAQSQQFTVVLRSPTSQRAGDGVVNADLARFYESAAPPRTPTAVMAE